MVVLGIESSAHTLGVGISENGKVLANEKLMYRIEDKGVIPAKAADLHAENAKLVVEAALSKAGISISDVTGVGYTKGPGMGPCLRVGQLIARTISVDNSIPIVPVNHAIGHIEVARHLSRAKDPLVIYVSGGNSQILGIVNSPSRHYHVYGETLDIGVGNMLDNFARAAHLNPAWGSSVARAAENGSYIDMPYTVKGMDFTFTGILTHAIKALESNDRKDVAYSLQENAFAMLCEAAERALMLTKKNTVLLCGGVAQSKRLRQMVSLMVMSHGVRSFAAPDEYNADNGAMIAVVAEKMLANGMGQRLDCCDINQRYRVDSAEIRW
jgi:glycoprotease/Kae1 family metallohydrolase